MLKQYVKAVTTTGDLRDRMKRQDRDESGAALIEYSVLIGLITVAAVATIETVRVWVARKWRDLSTAVAARFRRPSDAWMGDVRPFGPQYRTILQNDAAIRIVEQVVLCSAMGVFYYVNAASHRPLNMIVALNDVVTVFFITFRRSASAISGSLRAWLLALGATTAGMLMRPGGAPVTPELLTISLMVAGFTLTLSAKARLNWSFGIAPANRGVKVEGIYALVRHPMYLGYTTIQIVYALNNPTYWNMGIIAAVFLGQCARIYFEEMVLGSDPAYGAYKKRVKYRLIYGIY